MFVGGVGSAATLGGATATLRSVATTLGAVGWVTLTLGSVVWRVIWVVVAVFVWSQVLMTC